MQPLTLHDVIVATGGEAVQVASDLPIDGVSTDTRTLAPGELFVAVIGERFDGHSFLDEAATRGAPAVLVARERLGELTLPKSVSVVAVEDTVDALQALAHWHRSQFDGPVVAVTGSNGKTTTKDLIAAVLSQRFAVLATQGNLNTEIGMAMTLLRRGPDHQAIVVEMGMRGAGQIAGLTRVAAPSIGVVTNVGPVHVELLGSIDAVAAAKQELVEGLPADGLAVLNADDSRVSAMAQKTQARVITYGLGTGGHITAKEIHSLGLDGYTFQLEYQGERHPVRLPMPGRHNISNALAAAAVGTANGMTLQEIAQGLERVKPSGMRMQVEQLAGGIAVINDAYNASPASMRVGLAALADAPATRRIAVLGDMLELGAISESEHRGVGQACAAHGVDRLITVGERAAHIAAGAIEAGVESDAVDSVEHPDQAVAMLLTELRPGDVVLVKASRGLQLERVVEGLRNGLQEKE